MMHRCLELARLAGPFTCFSVKASEGRKPSERGFSNAAQGPEVRVRHKTGTSEGMMSFLPLLTRWSHSASLRNFLYRKMRGFQASWMTSPVHSIWESTHDRLLQARKRLH